MAKLKKGILKKTSEREKCKRILKKARVDVYVPRSLEVWKFATNISYVCIFEKNQCVQAYLTANNKYNKPLTPYIFWDISQQRAFEKKYHTQRFLNENTGEQQYELILKMQRYYQKLKEKGRFE